MGRRGRLSIRPGGVRVAHDHGAGEARDQVGRGVADHDRSHCSISTSIATYKSRDCGRYRGQRFVDREFVAPLQCNEVGRTAVVDEEQGLQFYPLEANTRGTWDLAGSRSREKRM